MRSELLLSRKEQLKSLKDENLNLKIINAHLETVNRDFAVRISILCEKIENQRKELHRLNSYFDKVGRE